MLDRELYVPEHTWFGDRERCAEAGIGEDVTFATRPMQVKAMIKRAVAAKVPFAWFVADEEFGQNPGLRDFLEHERIAYVMAVPKNTEFTDTCGQHTTVEEHAEQLSRNAFQRRACGIGSKGFRVYDWALIDAAEEHHQFLIRRSLDDGKIAYFHCFNPRREPVGELVRTAGKRWPVEECFEAAKQEAGLDQYQVRKYDAWYRHITMSMLALCLLAVMRKTVKKGGLPPVDNPTLHQE